MTLGTLLLFFAILFAVIGVFYGFASERTAGWARLNPLAISWTLFLIWILTGGHL